MGQNRDRRNGRQATYDKNRRTQEEYIYGNAVRRLEPRQWEEPRRGQPHPEVRRNREKARHMNLGYVLFLAVALCVSAFILVNYIQMQTELTNLTKSVANKESELNSLKMANDEEYNRIVSSIDLEEIKRVAMGELGMIYAQEGQIITYENESSDYMRQMAEIDY